MNSRRGAETAEKSVFIFLDSATSAVLRAGIDRGKILLKKVAKHAQSFGFAPQRLTSLRGVGSDAGTQILVIALRLNASVGIEEEWKDVVGESSELVRQGFF